MMTFIPNHTVSTKQNKSTKQGCDFPVTKLYCVLVKKVMVMGEARGYQVDNMLHKI